MRHVVGVTLLAVVIATGAAATAAPRSNAKLCTADEVRRTVAAFVHAFNRGDRLGLDTVWAAEPDFQWYSTPAPGLRLRAAAQHRRSLVRYFLRRHAKGERLELTWLRVNGNTNARKPYGNFEYRLVRHADDLEPTDYHGKGALHCYSWRADQLIVWSMAEAAPAPMP